MFLKQLALAVTTAMAATPGFAQESDEVANCVYLPKVDRTEVVDDDTVLFYMTDDTVYRNVLPNSCPGLDSNQPFLYRVTTSQLCSVDIVTVLERVGFGFMPGASCGLGKFQSISVETAEEIKAAADEEVKAAAE